MGFMTRDHERIVQAEGWMREAFGADHRTYTQRFRTEKLSVLVTEAVRILDNADVRALIHSWKVEDGKTNKRGRKQIIDEYAALAILLIQMRYNGILLFTRMVETLSHLTPTDLRKLGIHRHDMDENQWYDRLWRAYARLQDLIDEFPGNRKYKPTREEFVEIVKQRDPVKMAVRRARFTHLTNALVEASISFMPREIRRRYNGNLAIDATFTKHNGRLGGLVKQKLVGEELESARAAGDMSAFKLVGDHGSINYDGGWYVRTESHDGSFERDVRKRAWGMEAEIATWVPNAPGGLKDFPLVISAGTFHTPGSISGAAHAMINSIKEREHPIDHVMADLAYLPSSKPEDLQGPLALLGARIVCDYKVNQKGIQASYKHAIQVEGQWYLAYMPRELIEAEALYEEAKARADVLRGQKLFVEAKALVNEAKAQRDERHAEREDYRLKPKGRRRPNGSRQYMYPTKDDYGMLFDADTGEEIEPNIPPTVVIPMEVGLKYGQEYAFRSEKWRAYYGMRNVIESQNAYIKDGATEDIGSPSNRRARGNTFAALAVTLAAVSANLRRILAFIKDALAVTSVTPKNKHSMTTFHSIHDLPDNMASVPTDHPDDPPPST